MAKQGLYANIHKRRKAGKKPRPAGHPDRPSNADFARSKKTAKPRPKRRS